jgi:hypothetical protein
MAALALASARPGGATMNFMPLAQFDRAVNYRGTRSLKSGGRKSSAGIIGLHNQLAALHAMAKTDLYGRWKVMTDLASACHAYVEGKRATGKNVNKPKYLTITQLEYQLIDTIVKERKRYVGGTTPQNRGIAAGANNPHHSAVRFEKAITLTKGPEAGKTMHGQNLYDKAVASGVALNGKSDPEVAYLLRRFLKSYLASPEFAQDNADMLEFLHTDAERARYAIDFAPTQAMQGLAPFSTVGSLAGLPDEATVAISPDGDWFSKTGRTPGGDWHHSSYMGGGDVLFAGCIRTSVNGTVQYISNASGHYSPKLQDCLNAAQALKDSGLNPLTWRKASFYYTNFGDLPGGRPNTAYLFPCSDFLATRGQLPAPAVYETTISFSQLKWASGNAPQRTPTTVGAGGIINFPA